MPIRVQSSGGGGGGGGGGGPGRPITHHATGGVRGEPGTPSGSLPGDDGVDREVVEVGHAHRLGSYTHTPRD